MMSNYDHGTNRLHDDDSDVDDDGNIPQFTTGATDITSTNITFDVNAIGEDLERFQSDPIVKKALEEGVDLRQYSRSIDKDLQEIEKLTIKDVFNNIEQVGKLHKDITYCKFYIHTQAHT